jgi:RNA 2',3'-cyclic 3'-phosphodiesterase
VRLFVALDLPGRVVEVLAGWALGAEREGLRLPPPYSLHVTLAFLGGRPDEEAAPIGAALAGCASPVPGLALGEPAWLGRGGVLAVELVDGEGACGRLQTAVSGALEALGAYRPEARPFRPHVTVARVRHRARVARGLPRAPGGPPFAGEALTLYRSRPGRGGARYEPLARMSLTA